MKTPILPTVTNELIAELEAAADTSIEGCSVWYEEDGFLITLADTCDQPFMAKASPATVKALLAHIADLKLQLAATSVDAERYRWLRNEALNAQGDCPIVMFLDDSLSPANGSVTNSVLDLDGLDVAIDAARNPSAD